MRFIVACALPLFAVGCVRYPADGRTYASATAALAAFDRHSEEFLTPIVAREAPLAESAHLVVPSPELHRALATRGGYANGATYIGALNEHYVDAFIEALRRRGLFRRMAVHRTGGSPPCVSWSGGLRLGGR